MDRSAGPGRVLLGCGPRWRDPGRASARPFGFASSKPDGFVACSATASQFTLAHVTGDSASIDDMFTHDAKVLPPNVDPVVGRAAIADLRPVVRWATPIIGYR